MHESMLTFWLTAAAVSAAQAVCFAIPLTLGWTPTVPFIVAGDFPFLATGNRPLDHPEVYEATRRAFKGWRAIWPQLLRTGAGGVVSFWVMSRVVVASIYRHLKRSDVESRSEA